MLKKDYQLFDCFIINLIQIKHKMSQ